MKKDIDKKTQYSNSVVQYRKRSKTVNKKNKNRTKKYKNSYKIRKQKTHGGMRKLLTNESLNNFKNPHNNEIGHEKDCCATVFSLFGMKDKMVRYYQELAQLNGLTLENIQKAMNEIHSGYNHVFERSAYIPTGFLSSVLNVIYGSIEPGFGAVGGLMRNDGTQHCIAYGKSIEGIRYLFDVQNQVWYEGDSVTTYCVNEKAVYLYILNTYDHMGNIIQLDDIGDNIE